MRIHYPQQMQESTQELAALEKSLRGQPTAMRVQMLRLLKDGAVPSVAPCAPLVGYSATQLHRWWAAYRTGGLAALLQHRTPPGKPSRLTQEAWAGLQHELRARRIAQLADAQRYLQAHWGIAYRSLNGIWWPGTPWVQQRGVRLKTGRRQHRRSDVAQQTQFKKTSLAS